MADAAAPEGVAVGRVLGGRYRIEGLLGAGAMGLVYLARQLSVDREVVIKTLRVSPTDAELNALLAKRLKVEAFATARLDHPSTVRLLDFAQNLHLEFVKLSKLNLYQLFSTIYLYWYYTIKHHHLPHNHECNHIHQIKEQEYLLKVLLSSLYHHL